MSSWESEQYVKLCKNRAVVAGKERIIRLGQNLFFFFCASTLFFLDTLDVSTRRYAYELL